MFKLNESVYDEVAEQLEKNLNKFASNNATQNDKKLIEALELLNKSAETLELFGFDKEANVISKLITIASLNKQADEKDKVYFTLEDMQTNYPKEYAALPDNLKNKLAVMYFIDPDFTEGSPYTIMALEGGAKSYAYNTQKQSWDEMEYPLKSFAAKKIASDEIYFGLDELKSKFPKAYSELPLKFKETSGIQFFIHPNFTAGFSAEIIAKDITN